MARPRQSFTAEQREAVKIRISTLLAEGKTQVEILESIEIKSSRLISDVRRSLGLPRKSVKTELMERDVLRLHGDGNSVTQIASATGKSLATVANAMRRLNIPAQQHVRPVMLVGVGRFGSPTKTLKKLRKQFPDVQWTLGRVMKESPRAKLIEEIE